MISDGQKLALLAVASLLGVFVGFRVTNSINSEDAHLQATRAVEQRLLLEEQASNQMVSDGATGVNLAGSPPPKWQLVTGTTDSLAGCTNPLYTHQEFFPEPRLC